MPGEDLSRLNPRQNESTHMKYANPILAALLVSGLSLTFARPKEGWEPLGGVQVIAPGLNGAVNALLYTQSLVKHESAKQGRLAAQRRAWLHLHSTPAEVPVITRWMRGIVRGTRRRRNCASPCS